MLITDRTAQARSGQTGDTSDSWSGKDPSEDDGEIPNERLEDGQKEQGDIRRRKRWSGWK